MANNGPLGGFTNQPRIDSGTLIRHQTPSPGPIGAPKSSTPEDGARSLTTGEIKMAKMIFGGSIFYDTVRVHKGDWIAQGSNTAVTPDGEMYFPYKRFKEDFSTARDSEKRWFIHEMTHVWQYQLKYSVIWGSIWGTIKGFGSMSYEYTLDEDQKLRDYNMEAQGDILADYFALKYLNNPTVVKNVLNETPLKTYSVEDYERTLKDFLAKPADKNNLP